ncbi:MAG: hypothetical protein M3406_10665 [Chloroflexota bacterium]|nr:hypothetical protein [Chloroflexota bacterium]
MQPDIRALNLRMAQATVAGSIQDALNTSGTEIEEFPHVDESAFEVTPSENVVRD